MAFRATIGYMVEAFEPTQAQKTNRCVEKKTQVKKMQWTVYWDRPQALINDYLESINGFIQYIHTPTGDPATVAYMPKVSMEQPA